MTFGNRVANRAIEMEKTNPALTLYLFTILQKSSFFPVGQMNVDGRARTYLLNLPPDYYDTSNLTLVIVLHGFGGSASQAEADYGVTDKANAENFIVVYPDGVPGNGPFRLRSWNTGTCCPVAQTDNVDDVHFISVLIDRMIADYKVTENTGYSLTEWKDHTGKVAIDLYLTQDGGHSWPGGLKPRDKADPPSSAVNATDLLWDFFQHYSLP
jgi:poly(3-hydroxybutyrate) depolymerase